MPHTHEDGDASLAAAMRASETLAPLVAGLTRTAMLVTGNPMAATAVALSAAAQPVAIMAGVMSLQFYESTNSARIPEAFISPHHILFTALVIAHGVSIKVDESDQTATTQIEMSPLVYAAAAAAFDKLSVVPLDSILRPDLLAAIRNVQAAEASAESATRDMLNKLGISTGIPPEQIN